MFVEADGDAELVFIDEGLELIDDGGPIIVECPIGLLPGCAMASVGLSVSTAAVVAINKRFIGISLIVEPRILAT